MFVVDCCGHQYIRTTGLTGSAIVIEALSGLWTWDRYNNTSAPDVGGEPYQRAALISQRLYGGTCPHHTGDWNSKWPWIESLRFWYEDERGCATSLASPRSVAGTVRFSLVTQQTATVLAHRASDFQMIFPPVQYACW
jgi:hypothetical protein